MNLTIKHIRIFNLRALIKQSGESKGRFAQKIDTAPAYLSQILSENNKRGMGDLVARKIETKLNLSKGWMDRLHDDDWRQFVNGESLDQHEEIGEIEPNAYFLGYLPTWDDVAPLDKDEVVLPFLSNESIAGIGLSDMQATPGLKMRFSKSTLEKLGVHPETALCLTVSGNSMAPVMPDGATLGIDTSKTVIDDGDIYAIDHAAKLRVKIIYRIPGGGIRLRSFNSAEWPDEHIPVEDLKHIRIMGRVFWWSAFR